MINGIGVHIKVKNFPRSREFYEALGFESVFSYGQGLKVQEIYSGMVFQHGSSKIEIADGHRAVNKSVFQESIPSSKISLMINIDSLQEVIEKAARANIPIAVPPRHYYWNTLELVIKDPDGVVLVFIAPYSDHEAKAINADTTFSKPPHN